MLHLLLDISFPIQVMLILLPLLFIKRLQLLPTLPMEKTEAVILLEEGIEVLLRHPTVPMELEGEHALNQMRRLQQQQQLPLLLLQQQATILDLGEQHEWLMLNWIGMRT